MIPPGFLMRLDEMDLGTLRQAVEAYVRHAYPEGPPPREVLARLDCLAASSLTEALASECVERESDREGGTTRYLLRLGSADYPHVKLALERCSGGDEFVLSVDTHDRHFILPEKVPDETRERFERIQRLNCELKRSIESDWNEAGLPTFRRFIVEGLAVGK